MMENPIIFTNLPLCEELCHILVSIDPYEKKDKSVKSDFQWQLLKTRLLLYSERNVIATPAAGLLRYIHVVSKKEFLNSGSLNTLFQKNKLKVESVGALSLSMYEQCLMYNLLVKLSPSWNKVEKYFVEGRYFLMHRGALHAVELNVILKGDMLMLYASPLRLWLREVSLFDLLPSSNIEETVSKPFFIDLHSERQWVHVLPSFKRGHLVYVTNRIPKDSTFEDYQQMRRHWKNTYGYRLPEDDSSPIFVGVSFFGDKDFLYPLQCVRRGMHMNMNEPNVVANFAKAVASKAAFVCGKHIKLRNLTELQNMPKIKVCERLKWSESGLAELDSELMNKWLFQSDDSMNMTFETQNISLYKQKEEFELPFEIIEDDSKKRQEYDNWLSKCSQFIDKLTHGSQKRSFLKASRPNFIKSPAKVDSGPETSFSVFTKLEEDSFLHEKGSYQICTPFKPSFNKIELKGHNTKLSVASSGMEQHEVHKTLGNSNGTVFENNFGQKDEISHVNAVLFADVPFKPIFKKKKSKGPIELFEEDKKKISRSVLKSKTVTSKSYMNVKKNFSNEEIQKKRKKKKPQTGIEFIKKSKSAMASEANVQEMGAEISVPQIETKANKINHEKVVESQVTNKPESSSVTRCDEYPLPVMANSAQSIDAMLEEGKSKINTFVCEMQALPVVYENKNIDVINRNMVKASTTSDISPNEDKFINFVSDMQESPLVFENKNIITKQNVIKRLTPSSAPKERKKSALLTTTEIENLVFLNQLEKANVPSLCCYLKGKGIPFSKDRKKNVLLEKVKEIIASGRKE